MDGGRQSHACIRHQTKVRLGCRPAGQTYFDRSYPCPVLIANRCDVSFRARATLERTATFGASADRPPSMPAICGSPTRGAGSLGVESLENRSADVSWPARRSCPKAVPDAAGAGNGNRTRVFSLEGCCTTIVLYPQEPDFTSVSCVAASLFCKLFCSDAGADCHSPRLLVNLLAHHDHLAEARGLAGLGLDQHHQ